MEKVVFLDRDGTINIEKEYLYKKEDFQFIDGTIEAIRLLNEYGFKVVVVSNQAGIGRGLYNESDVEKLQIYINNKLEEYNAYIDDFYYCPHHPLAGIGEYKLECDCRKPKTGMFLEAEKKYKVDKSGSWMIGDKMLDIMAGKSYGVKTILVGTGYGEEEFNKTKDFPEYDYYSKNLFEAVKKHVLCLE